MRKRDKDNNYIKNIVKELSQKKAAPFLVQPISMKEEAILTS